MVIGIASDHRGFELKEYLKKELIKKYKVIDYGTNSSDSVDYPQFAFKIGEQIGKDINFGIVICGTGIGISIAANKVKGVRCALISDVTKAEITRLHNDSNVLALDGNTSFNLAFKIVDKFLTTNYSQDERHQRRLKMIEDYEMKND